MDRRQYLGLTGASITVLLGGCSTDTSSNTPSADTATSTLTDTATPEETEEATGTPEEPMYPDTGSLSFNPRGGLPADHALFEGDVNLRMFSNNPEDYEMPSMQELRIREHFNQDGQIAEGLNGTIKVGENGGREKTIGQILREFGENLTDRQWVLDNIHYPFQRQYGGEIPDFFKESKYIEEGTPLGTRIKESNYLNLSRNLENVLMGVADSNLDYFRTAALSAAEYETAGRETYTSHVNRLGVKPRGLSVDSRSIRARRKACNHRSHSASLT